MCNGDFSLKVIALSCLFVLFIDFYVLADTIAREHKLQDTVTPETFEKCFHRQIQAKIVFIIYVINSVFCSLVFFTAHVICDEGGEVLRKVVAIVSHYMHVCFGPALFTCCCFGFADIRSLANKCTEVS